MEEGQSFEEKEKLSVKKKGFEFSIKCEGEERIVEEKD
jgi:hypothetical protein